jgi:hypothetical protein
MKMRQQRETAFADLHHIIKKPAAGFAARAAGFFRRYEYRGDLPDGSRVNFRWFAIDD